MSFQAEFAAESGLAAEARDPGPLVSLGLPVYNGANFLRPALDSLLAQTYAHWELIISDNGSTDATQDICREYASRDARIRYHREEINRGATWNHNRVFELSRGPLFRWTAHDDVCAPELLERCVAAMQARPKVVLCHPRTRIIDPRGELICDYGTRLRTDSPRADQRFHDLICLDHACFPIFGIVRAELLRKTFLMGDFVGADRNLLAELALHGPFHEVPEFLFLRRDHPDTSTRRFPSAKDRMMWFRAAGASHRSGRYPTLRRAVGYWNSISRAPLDPRERLACLGVLAKWVLLRMRSLLLGRSAPALGRSEVFVPAAPQAPRPSPAYLALKRVFTYATSIL